MIDMADVNSMTDRTRIANVLDAAATLIEPEGRWTQGESARGKSGKRVEPRGRSAVCFCALGAIAKVAKGEQSRAALASSALSKSLSGKYGWVGVPVFNDAPGRTQAEVVAALRNAAKEVRGG